MHKQHPMSNPFALMMDPERVVQAMERSERLARLQRRVCHPLDRPLIACKVAELDEFDSLIDAQPEPQWEPSGPTDGAREESIG
jgi:hypothetical protein